MSSTTINENGDRTIETNNGFQYRNLKDDENSESTTPKTTSMLKIDGKLTNNNNSSIVLSPFSFIVVELIFVWFGFGLVLHPVVYSFVDGES
jgi:hypothetical protein